MSDTSWEAIREYLKSKISESSYEVWIKPITLISCDDDRIELQCPNRFFANWVHEHYLSILKNEPRFNQVAGQINFIFAEQQTQSANDLRPEKLNVIHKPLIEVTRPSFSSRYTFDEFIVGQSNQWAYDVCNATAKGEMPSSNIIYLCARTGLGKSHLAHAVGNTLFDRHPSSRLNYLSANEFTSQVVRAIKDGSIDAFKQRFRGNYDALLLEGVHCLMGRERTQAELAIALDYMMEAEKPVIVTSNAAPAQLQALDEQLHSRLNSALVVSINPPDKETRRRIILRKARYHGLLIPDEVLEFLAENLSGDIRRIEGAVIGLVARVNFRHNVNLDMAREIVSNLLGRTETVSVDTIRKLVCKHYQVSHEELKSKSRKRSVVFPRQVAMFLSRKFTHASLQVIGMEYNRDHATVLHSINNLTKQMNTTVKTRLEVEYLTEQIEKAMWK